MGKKNSFGKFLAFTTTVATICGVCYVFRDQIRESSIYKKASEKFCDLRNKMNDKFTSEEDDFIFDDDFEDDFEDDVFAEDAKQNREYTSIIINPKEDEAPVSDAAKEVAEDISKAVENLKETGIETAEDTIEKVTDIAEDTMDGAKEVAEDMKDAVQDSAEDMKEIFADVSIPTISFGNNNADKKDETAATEEVSEYENEGLSDVSEDPDVLADMDRLDF